MIIRTFYLIVLALAASEPIRRKRQGFIDLSQADQCSTPDKKRGICLNIKQCPPMVDLLVNRRKDPQVASYLRSSICGYEGLDPKVCCPGFSGTLTPHEGNGQENPQPQLPTPTTTTRAPEVVSQKSATSERIIPEPGTCGFSEAQLGRVVGGNNATLGAWPWMAALGYKSTKGRTDPLFLCGGTLITKQHVLTAAHCVYNKKNLYMVRVGDLNLYSDTDGATPMDILIRKPIVHEAYSPTMFTNDIALLALEEDVPFTKLITPICLPLSREMRARTFEDRRPFIAGWGTTSFNGPSSATLLELMIPVVKEKDCQRAFASFKGAVIDSKVICAGYLTGGKDACRGDSGGPLMTYNNEDKMFYQIGVVSYGYKCAEPGYPGVYTRVTSFADWIEEAVANS